jgi:predicted MFS family arabinose efflux permease
VARWQAAVVGYLAIQALIVLARPGISVFQMTLVPAQWRPTISASCSMAMTLGMATLAFGGGQILTTLNYRTLFLTGAGLVFAGVLFFWGYFRVPRGELARGQSVRPEAVT